jgi:hypothetical protein
MAASVQVMSRVKMAGHGRLRKISELALCARSGLFAFPIAVAERVQSGRSRRDVA